MAYATLIIEIPDSPVESRSSWQNLRDGLFSKSKTTEGITFRSENCVSINLSLALPFFAEAVFYCSRGDLRYSVLVSENEQQWVTTP